MAPDFCVKVAVAGGVSGELIAPFAFEIDGVGEHQAATWVWFGENFWNAVTGFACGPRVDRAQRCGLVGDERHSFDGGAEIAADGAGVIGVERHGALHPGGVCRGELATARLRGKRIACGARGGGLARDIRIEAQRACKLGRRLPARTGIEQREGAGDAVGRDKLVAGLGGNGAIKRNVEGIVRGRQNGRGCWCWRGRRRWLRLGRIGATGQRHSRGGPK